jgi:polyphosphate kinase 2 (PPK2 family)
MLDATDSPKAHWHVIDGTQDRSRNLAVARIILEGLRKFLARPAGPRVAGRRRPAPFPDALARVDLAARFSNDKAYEMALEKQQGGLARVSRRAREEGLSSVIVFEGWDAAGKGGAIRRITHALDVRDFRVVPIAAPGAQEQAHHYLWRFWQQLPAAGQMTIFDRSWYGRVLVERVEGLARPDEWQRAYDEILEFEDQLLEHGTVLLKFWLHIDADEQLDRFAEREKTPYKKYRIVPDDYRNRVRRADYVKAANEMIARTSSRAAPWRLIPANDKRYARVAVLRTVRDALRTVCKPYLDLSPGRG